MKALLLAAALLSAGAVHAQQRDARGIPVQSDAATPPAGANQTPPAGSDRLVPAQNQAQVFQTRPATGEYPACTRGQTDRCTQTYERGARRPR